MPPHPRTAAARPAPRLGLASPRALSAVASIGVHAAALACAGFLAFGSGGGGERPGFRGEIVYAPPAEPPEFASEREPSFEIELPEAGEPQLVESAIVAPEPVREPAPPPVAVSELDARLEIDRAVARWRRPRPPSGSRDASGGPVAASAAPAVFAVAPPPPDTLAEPVDAPPPAYPRLSVRLSEEGAVLLRITVGADGAVRAVAVVESSGSERLDGAAVECVRGWRYRAATHAGVPIESDVLHRVTFELERAR
jgi:protein TonB